MPYSDSISWTVARVLVASLLLGASTNLGAQGNTKESADLPSYTGSSGESPVSVNSSTGQLNVSVGNQLGIKPVSRFLTSLKT